MKVVVYAICKNEEQFARRWAASMSEADEMRVLDTGSTDNTVRELEACGVLVRRETVQPWRFDTARNLSLQFVPPDTDICVCTDLDEVFEPGWRRQAEAAWLPGTHRLKYRYVWSHTADGGDGVIFYIEKIHAYGCYAWVNPVHEVLAYTGPGPETVRLCEARLAHFPDDAKSRASYLPLLELAVAERPDDDRNVHYLGREYLFYGRYDEAIATLQRHLALPNALWADERAASMRYIAKCYIAKQNDAEAERWLLRALAEAPHLREPAVDLAALFYARADWPAVLYFAERALAVTDRSMSYINEPLAWSDYPDDIASVACYHLGLYARAADHAEQALRLSPLDERIQGNLHLYKSKLT